MQIQAIVRMTINMVIYNMDKNSNNTVDNFFTVISNDKGLSYAHSNISKQIVVNLLRHTYVFIPFKATNGFVNSNSSYNTVSPNTVTIPNTSTQSTPSNDVSKIEWILYPTDDDTKTAKDYTITKFSTAYNPSITCKLKSNVTLPIDDEQNVQPLEIFNVAKLKYQVDDTPLEITTVPSTTKVYPLDITKTALDSQGNTLDEKSIVGLKDNVTLNISNLELTDTISNAFNPEGTATVAINNSKKLVSNTITFEDGKATIKFATNQTMNVNSSVDITYMMPVFKDIDDDQQSTIIQNEVTSKIGTAKTPTITTTKINKLDVLLQKGIKSINNSTDDLYHYNINQVDKSIPMEIVYNAVVFSDTSNTIDLPVEYLIDELPKDFTFISMENGATIQNYDVSHNVFIGYALTLLLNLMVLSNQSLVKMPFYIKIAIHLKHLR